MLSTDLIQLDSNKYWKITIPSVNEPVSVDEIKQFARIDDGEEETLLTSLIKSARTKIEDYLKKSLMYKTIEMYFNEWPGKEVFLPLPPLISVTSLVTLNEDGTETVYSSDNYFVVTTSIPGKIIIKRNSIEPSNTERDYDGYKITFIAGYGTNPEQVPNEIKTAIKRLVTYYYEKRILTEDEIPPEITKDIRRLRLMRWA